MISGPPNKPLLKRSNVTNPYDAFNVFVKLTVVQKDSIFSLSFFVIVSVVCHNLRDSSIRTGVNGSNKLQRGILCGDLLRVIREVYQPLLSGLELNSITSQI